MQPEGRRFECNSIYEVHAKDQRTIRIGGWYYGFDCRECDHRFAVFEDASGGRHPTVIEGQGRFRVRCPHCDCERFYSARSILHYQFSG